MADIPVYLITEILCRCPVKSLIRFKTVSPKWFSLISSSNFVSRHRRYSLAPILLQVSRPQPFHQLLFSYGIRSVKPITHVHPIPTFPGSDAANLHKLELIGSPNGVVCVVQHSDFQNFALWNPATRSSLRLPAPTLINTHTRVRVGMGFNPLTGDYKIVRLLERNFDLSDQVEVLSVNSGRWTVSTTHKLKMRMTSESCVVANGVPYWIGMKTFPEEFLVRLVLFDVRWDSFHREEFAWVAESSRTLLGVRNDFLCAMAWEKSRLSFDLWVKEGPGRQGWIQRYVGVEPPGGALVAEFCGDRGIVFREDEGLVVFDPTEVEEDDMISVVDHFEPNDRLWVLSWTESLTKMPQLGAGNRNRKRNRKGSMSLGLIH